MMINTKKSSSSSPSKQQKRHKNPNNKTGNQNCGGRRRRRSYIISFVLPITVVIVLSLLQLFGFSPSASLSLIISKNDDLYLYLIPSSGGGDNTTTTTTTTTSRRHREESSSEETIPVPNGGLISILKQYPQHNNNSNNYIKNNKQRLPRRGKTNIYILNDDECCRFQKNTNFFSTNAQGKHLLIDGMQRSNILQRTYDPHNNNSTTVWFYLLIREFQCTSILKRIEESIIERQYQQQKQHQKRMLKRNKKSGKNKNKNRNKKQTTSKVAAPVEFDTSIPIPAWDIYILDSSDGGFIQSPNQRYSGCIKQMDQLMSSLDNNYYNHYNHNNNRTTTNAHNEDNNSSTDHRHRHRHRHRIHMVTRTMVKGRGIKFEDELFIKAINKIDADADADTNITDTDTNVTDNTDNKPSPSPLTPPPIILLENNNSKPFGPLGEKIDWLNHSMSNYIYGGIPRQFRYFVRSDMIDWIENEFNGTLYYNYSTSSRTSTSSISASSSNSNTQKQERHYIDLVYGGNRTIADVAHFTSRKDTLQLRGHVNQFLIKMEEDQKKRQQQQQQQPHNNDTTPTNSNNDGIKFFIGIAGGTGKYGRKSAQDKYCDMLLGSKIIIVGQRPRWEDHWRLMEALTFGGLVFTDSYVGDMPYGLIENESIIIYRNIMQLKEKIVYYLKPENEVERLRIAYKGHHTAIDFHRSYQYLERIIFEEYPI